MDEQNEQEEPIPFDPERLKASVVKVGPFTFSGRFSVFLIFLIVIGINVCLLIAVVFAALHRSGNL